MNSFCLFFDNLFIQFLTSFWLFMPHFCITHFLRFLLSFNSVLTQFYSVLTQFYSVLTRFSLRLENESWRYLRCFWQIFSGFWRFFEAFMKFWKSIVQNLRCYDNLTDSSQKIVSNILTKIGIQEFFECRMSLEHF